MKILKNILSLAVALVAIACGSDDNETSTATAAPVLVSSSITEGEQVKPGDKTIALTFDCNISFASSNVSKITLSGGTVSDAKVSGVSAVLTITANCPDYSTNYTLTVPEGVVLGPSGDAADEVSISFSTIDKPEMTNALANANSTTKTQAVYDYLQEVYGQKVLSAMMANVNWNNTCSEAVYTLTGKYPAINCYDYIHLKASLAGQNWINYADITPAKTWDAAGGIVAASWHWMVPKTATFDESSLDPNSDYTYSLSSASTAFNAENTLTEGTWENQIFVQDLASIAAYLKLLSDANIPVLWRPFHEASGQWFWWGKSASSHVAMWQYMFDYFKEYGLNNLIWVWTSQVGDDDWYPGDEYVDIVGCDLYGDATASCVSSYTTLSDTYPNKIITLSECGYSEYTSSRVASISSQWTSGAQWSWFMPWYDNTGATFEHADDDWWTDAMSQSYVVDRASLPSFE